MLHHLLLLHVWLALPRARGWPCLVSCKTLRFKDVSEYTAYTDDPPPMTEIWMESGKLAFQDEQKQRHCRKQQPSLQAFVMGCTFKFATHDTVLQILPDGVENSIAHVLDAYAMFTSREMAFHQGYVDVVGGESWKNLDSSSV